MFIQKSENLIIDNDVLKSISAFVWYNINDSKLRNDITDFLSRYTDFKIKCDDTNNPPVVIENSELVIELVKNDIQYFIKFSPNESKNHGISI